MTAIDRPFIGCRSHRYRLRRLLDTAVELTSSRSDLELDAATELQTVNSWINPGDVEGRE
jgi:hypothetical protein